MCALEWISGSELGSDRVGWRRKEMEFREFGDCMCVGFRVNCCRGEIEHNTVIR